MQKAWNNELQHFGQSYEETNVLDSAVLIMPLVFFMQAVSEAIISRMSDMDLSSISSPIRGSRVR